MKEWVVVLRAADRTRCGARQAAESVFWRLKDFMRGRDKSGDSPQTKDTAYIGRKTQEASDGLTMLSLLSLHFLAKDPASSRCG